MDEWLSNVSYICYIVEKNTNIFIDEDVNMIMVFDRYDSWCYEQELTEEQHKKNKNGSKG